MAAQIIELKSNIAAIADVMAGNMVQLSASGDSAAKTESMTVLKGKISPILESAAAIQFS